MQLSELKEITVFPIFSASATPARQKKSSFSVFVDIHSQNEIRTWCVCGQMDPIDNVEQVSENMQLYPLEHYLTGRTLILKYDPQVSPHLSPSESHQCHCRSLGVVSNRKKCLKCGSVYVIGTRILQFL